MKKSFPSFRLLVLLCTIGLIPEISSAGELQKKPVVRSEVTHVFLQSVRVTGGKDAGYEIGQLLHVFRIAPIDADPSTPAIIHVGAVTVDDVDKDHSHALIWGDAVIRRGDLLVPTTISRSADPESFQQFPNYYTHYLETDFQLRSIFSADGYAFLNDLRVSWIGSFYFASIEMAPLGFGWAEESFIASNKLMLSAGINLRKFSFGLGGGMFSTNGDMREGGLDLLDFDEEDKFYGYGSVHTETDYREEWPDRQAHAFAMSLSLRIGAMDGVNLSYSQALSFADSDHPVQFSAFAFKLSIPIDRRISFYMKAELAHDVMDVGVGVNGWLRGTGGPGSIGLYAAAGAGSLSRTEPRTSYDDDVSYVPGEISVFGPMLSLGMRMRFGQERPPITAVALTESGPLLESAETAAPIEKKKREDRSVVSEKKSAVSARGYYTQYLETEAVVSPVFGVGDDAGFGISTELRATRVDRKFYFGVRAAPVEVVFSDGADFSCWSLLVDGGWNGRHFAFGLGAGIGRIGEVYPESPVPLDAGLLLSSLRIGPRHHVHLDVELQGVISSHITGTRSIEGRFTVPVGRRTDLFLEGAVDFLGSVDGEGENLNIQSDFGVSLGAFVWLRGTGESGSVGLSFSGGWGGMGLKPYAVPFPPPYAGTSRPETPESIYIDGPIMSLGLLTRFGGVKHPDP